MRLATAFLSVLLGISPSALATSRVLLIGGGLEPDKDFVVPPAKNWLEGLTQLGWKPGVVFGDPHGILPRIGKNQTVANFENARRALRALAEKTKDGDNVLVLIITHGAIQSHFDSHTWQYDLAPHQTLMLADGPYPADEILSSLKAIAGKNRHGTTLFWNHSCFSGLSVRELQGTGVCAISISGPNQAGIRGNFSEILGRSLAGDKGDDPELAQEASLEKNEDHSMRSLLARSFALDEVTPSMVSAGFGLDSLNKEGLAAFVSDFRTLDKAVGGNSVDAWLNELSILATTVPPVNDVSDLLPFGKTPSMKTGWDGLRGILLDRNPDLMADIYSFVSSNRRSLLKEDPSNPQFRTGDLERLVNNPNFQAIQDVGAVTELAKLLSRVIIKGNDGPSQNFSNTLIKFAGSIRDRVPQEARPFLEALEDKLPFNLMGPRLQKSKADDGSHRARKLRNLLMGAAFEASTTPCAAFNLDQRPGNTK
ncbi:MAG: hypothetical protein V1798_09625 [Pseudomonadota bacterium]